MLSTDWVGENVIKNHQIIPITHQMLPEVFILELRFGYIKSPPPSMNG